MQKKDKNQSLLIKCKNCGSNMKYSIERKAIECESCKSLVSIKDTSLTEKLPIEEGLKQDVEMKADENLNYFKCENCGADITLAGFQISKSCPYCNSANVIQTHEIIGIKPNKVLKFEFGKIKTKEYFEKHVKKKFFVPSPFKKNIPESNIQSMYVPSFTFDVKTLTAYSGILYRIEHDSEGKSRRRNFSVKGKLAKDFKDLVVESSSMLSQAGLNNILPFNFSVAVDYKPEYLLGFAVERYDNKFEDVIKNSNQIIKERVKKDIIKKHNANGEVKLKMETQYSNYLYEYEILPIYFLRYNYKGKGYLAYMNGQNGKVGGKFPISPIKVTFVAIFAVLAVLLLIILSSM